MIATEDTAEDTGEDVKILAVGDMHRNRGFVENDVIPFALDNGCKVIVQVGDFGFVFSNNPDIVASELFHLNLALVRAGVTIVFLQGNHDNHEVLTRLFGKAWRHSPEGHAELASHIFYTGRTSAWRWAGVRIAAVGGAVSIDRNELTPGHDWWPEETLSVAEMEYAKHLGPVDLLFTHDAPDVLPLAVYPDPASAAHRAELTRIAEALQPAMWVHGHYHQSLHYEWQHAAGTCAVRGLDRDGASRQDSMVVVNLSALRKGLSQVHYGGRS